MFQEVSNSNTNFKRLAIFFACLLLFGIIINWIMFPMLIKKTIKKQIVLSPKSKIRQLWEKAPFAVDFKLYIFNVTNPAEVTDGGKPQLKEIGPYMFDEWKDKYDLEDNEEMDTVTYHMRNMFIFRPDKSYPLTGQEVLTIPHPIVMPMAVAVKRDAAPMMPLFSEALSIMFPVEYPFYTGKFLDIFYNGMPIDCSADVFSVKAVCTQFETGEVKGGVKYNETHFSFSLMGGANATDAGKYTVYRGTKNSKDVGRMVLYEDEEDLVTWGNFGHCNKLRGTDSTIFSPFVKKEDGIFAFAGDLCLSLGAHYEEPSTYLGIKTSRFGMDFGDIKNEPENHCYCNDPPDDCPIMGTLGLSKCVGGPLVVSLPHFYKADPKLLDDVAGLSPNEAEHKIFLDFETMTGSPLSAAKRLQFNLDIEAVEEVESMKNIRKMLLPFFWVEESANLNKTWVGPLKKLFLTLSINNSLKWTFTIVGLFGFLICIYFNSLKPKIIEIKSQTRVTNNALVNENIESTGGLNNTENNAPKY